MDFMDNPCFGHGKAMDSPGTRACGRGCAAWWKPCAGEAGTMGDETLHKKSGAASEQLDAWAGELRKSLGLDG